MDRFILRGNSGKQTPNQDPQPSTSTSGVDVDVIADSTPSPTRKHTLSSESETEREDDRPWRRTQVSSESEREDDPEPIEIDGDSGGEGAKLRQKAKLTSKRNYKQKFRLDWEHKYKDWLLKSSNNEAFCKVCHKSLQGGVFHLNRHAATQAHQSRIAALKSTVKITEPKFHGEGEKKKRLKRLIQEGELKMVMHLAEHNLPFRLMEHMPQFIKSVCPDSEIAKGIKCSRTKATQIAMDVLAPASLEVIGNMLQKYAYSLIIDETTDISTKKSLAIVARHFDEEAEDVKDRFLGLVEVERATADGLVETIKTALLKNKIPIQNMIGFAADNAAVMMGNKNGVQTQLKRDVPNLFVLGCVCHSFHLCASAACLKLPRTIEDLAKDIYSYFSNSSKRRDELGECQEFARTKPHEMLRPSQTRWLSLQAVVNRILEQWPALILFFTNAAVNDKLQAPQTILQALNTPVFKLYFTFLSYVLDLVNRLNLEFQSESPKIHTLSSRVSQLYRSLLRNFVKQEFIENEGLDSLNPSDPHKFLSLESTYFGAKTELLIANSPQIPHDQLHNFRLRALDFYVELCRQIKQRFKFNDPTLVALENIGPEVALSGQVASIIQLASLFPNFVPNNDIETLNTEWRLLPEIRRDPIFEKQMELVEFWCKVGKIKNGIGEPMFQHLSSFIKSILCLPHSSASAERVFSQLSLIKTKTRNRLMVETCSALLHTKALLKNDTCFTWQPTQNMLNRKIDENEIVPDEDITF